MKKMIHALRRFGPWIFVSEYLISPLYGVIWEYVINAPGKLLFLRSAYRGRRGDPALAAAGVTVARTPELTALAQRLRASLSKDAIDKARAEMLATNSEYSVDIFETLDAKSRVELTKFALSPVVLGPVMSYLRVAPRLLIPKILFNIPRPHLSEEGSKLWHRDVGYGYRGLMLFLALTDVDDESGPYYAMGTDVIPRHADIPKTLDPGLDVWRRYRTTNEEMGAHVDMTRATKLSGPAGTAAWVDGGNCYHKGGHCTVRERLMLFLEFATDDGDESLHVPGWSAFVDTNDPELRQLASDPLIAYITAPSDTAIMRRWKLWRLSKAAYRVALRYYMRPRLVA